MNPQDQERQRDQEQDQRGSKQGPWKPSEQGGGSNYGYPSRRPEQGGQDGEQGSSGAGSGSTPAEDESSKPK